MAVLCQPMFGCLLGPVSLASSFSLAFLSCRFLPAIPYRFVESLFQESKQESEVGFWQCPDASTSGAGYGSGVDCACKLVVWPGKVVAAGRAVKLGKSP